MIVTPVAKVPSALRKSRESNPSPAVLRTGAAWLPTVPSCAMSSTTAAPSERRIGRQSERHPAIDSAVDVPGQHVMGIGRMDVAKRALDRVSLVDGTPAGRSEKQVYRLGAEGRGKGAIAAVARPLLDARHDSGLGYPRRLIAPAQHDCLRRIGECGRFGEMDLDIGEIGDVSAGIGAEPVAGRSGEMLDRAAGDAERDAGDGKGKQADCRKLIQGPGIDFA